MVIQSRLAHRIKLPLHDLAKPYTIETAAENAAMVIDKVSRQGVSVYDQVTNSYASVATFDFEIAPISIGVILGLPFFEAQPLAVEWAR
ncbi:hypothetical protein HKX48_001561 [Thoreauomyces humboldtii]|nr:hypothetical protein HKX48_001561 [Thoreauomyces humboldtii]